jgi:pseudouridine-5'-phosphate glycosidase
MSSIPDEIILSKEVSRTLHAGKPIVALESTVVSHGLPYPENLELARDMETIVRKQNAIPATIAVIRGKIRVGLEPAHLELLTTRDNLRKISLRDFAPAITQEANGGTTVAGTMLIAETVGIPLLATGGIGGVHRNTPFDISTDLTQLSRSQVVVVCSGAKAILDLPATLERLETLGVPVIGYQTNEFPAFYSRESGLPVSVEARSPEEVAKIVKAHWNIGAASAALVVVPPPKEVAIPAPIIKKAIKQALKEAEAMQIRGQSVTPFLLKQVNEITLGDSLKANLGLLKNNALVAAQIAHILAPQKRVKSV